MKVVRVQGGGSGRVLLVISAVVVIAIIGALSFFLMQGPSYPGDDDHGDTPDDDGSGAGDVAEPKSTAEVIQKKVEECVNKNPTLTQEQCWDLKYHDMAIASYNQSLCENIKGDKVRDYCNRFFD